MMYNNGRLWVLGLLLAFSVFASEKSAQKEYAPLITDRAAVLETAGKISKKDYPDADSVSVSHAVNVDYRKDGTYTQLDEQYIKILTEKARRQYSTLSSYFTIPYQQIEDCRILLVEIIKPDGKVISIDLKKNSKLVVNNSSMSMNIYNPNDKVIRVNIPGLEIGDTLHYYMYDNASHPRARGIYADIFMFESTSPIIEKRVTVRGRKDFPLERIALRDGVGKTVEFIKSEDGEYNVYEWVGKNIAQAFPEPDSPPLYSCTQRVLVSTAKSWKEVSAWYWDLCRKPLAATTPAMLVKVEELTRNLKSPEEKIRAIFRWVSQKVRYMGITTETVSPGYEPHPVSETFNDMHGVCRDKAALLAAMLRLAEFEAYPVLINNGPKKDPEVPQPFFNHAITAVKIGSTYMLMDSTDENTKRLLPSYLNNCSYLVAKPFGAELFTSAIVPASDNLMVIETTGKLEKNGDFFGHSKLSFNGINDNAYRGYFARITPEQRRRFFESKIKDIYGAAHLDEFTISPKDMMDTSKPLEVEMKFSAKSVTVSGNDLSMLPLPFLGARVGMVNYVLGKAGLDKRRFPFKTDIACGVSENVRIELPKDYGKIVSMPVYKSVDNKQVLWKRSLAEVGGALMGKNEFQLRAVEFSPEEYAVLKKDLRRIEYNKRKMPVFAVHSPKPEEDSLKSADAVVMSDNVTYNILDQKRWVRTRKVKKKVITYAGMKDNSELKIYYNPVWEKVAVTEATVTGADGKMRMISPKEINILDQSWNGSAPRYPGGKILVASLPGVAVGSVINYTIRHEYFDRPFFAANETFRYFDPLVSKSVSVTYPQDYAGLKSVVSGGLQGLGSYRVSAADSAVIIDAGESKVDQTVVRRWAASDVDSVKRESDLPVWSSFNPTLFLSGGSWEGYAKSFVTEFERCTVDQKKAAQKAAELIAGAKSVREKIIRIRDFVAQNIRLAGPDLSDLPLSCLSPADVTLQERYGSSADRAALLYVLLKAAGIDSEYFLLTGYRDVLGQQKPFFKLASDGVFRGVMLRVKDGEKSVWLNDTDQYAQLGTLGNEGYFVFDPRSSEFSVLKASELDSSQQEVVYLLELQNDGSARITKSIYFYGGHYNRNKRMFEQMTPEKLRRYHQQKMTQLSYSAKADGELEVDFKHYPGVVKFSVNVARFAVRDGKFVYLSLPQTLRRVFGLTADERSNPLELRGLDELRISTLVSYTPELGSPAIAPKDFVWSSSEGQNKIEVDNYFYAPETVARSAFMVEQVGPVRDLLVSQLRNGRRVFVVRHSHKSSPALYPAALYPKLLQAQNELSGYYARMLMLQSAK